LYYQVIFKNSLRLLSAQNAKQTHKWILDKTNSLGSIQAQLANNCQTLTIESFFLMSPRTLLYSVTVHLCHSFSLNAVSDVT